jgi:hypothetical protein
MNEGRERFILKIVLIVPLMMAAVSGIGFSVEATTARFGGIGWLFIIPGVLIAAAGALVAWATAITGLDRRGLRRYRVAPLDRIEDGQKVALSGTVRISGEPLITPFSRKPCAAFSFRVTGEGRSGSDNHSRSRLCLLGFGLADAALDCGERSFPLRAVPDVGTDLREIATSSDWRERGMALIDQASEQWERADQPDAEGQRIQAARFVQPRVEKNLFVAGTRGTSNTLGITEDHLPIDEPVTVLATYDAMSRSLKGSHVRDMKVFAGHLDDKLAVLDDEWRKGATVSSALLAVALVLLTLAAWWPA